MSLVENTEPLTKDFCSTTDKRLYFAPTTEQEAAIIQECLFEMGFKWYREEDQAVRHLKKSVEGTIYLDTDKTLMQADKQPSNSGLLCHVTQFKSA